MGQELVRVLNDGGDTGDGLNFEVQETEGDIENIDLLLQGKTEFSFVVGDVLLSRASQNQIVSERIRAVARLYPSEIQIVASPDRFPQERFSELASWLRSEAQPDEKPLKIFAGSANSGTRLRAARVLQAYELSVDDDYKFVPRIRSYDEAATRLIADPPGLDLAFFTAGAPNDAVVRALRGRAQLLDVRDPGFPDLGEPARIPARTYEGQGRTVLTFANYVYLVCRTDLERDLVARVVRGIADNLHELALGHDAARKIDLECLIKDNPPGIRWHEGVEHFRKEDADTVLIICC